MLGANITDMEFDRLRRFFEQASGIRLGDGKRELVCGRLAKRLRQLALNSYRDYIAYIEQPDHAEERQQAIDLLTTNETHFFREPRHFDFLRQDIQARLRRGDRGAVRIWSAACSTGEEPYTIAITLLEAGHTRFRLVASALSSRALAQASSGVYRLDRVSSVPRPVLKKYFERGLGEQDGLARVAPSVRRLVQFQQLNLLEVGICSALSTSSSAAT